MPIRSPAALLATLLCTALPAPQADANDSIARIGAGGLTFLETQDIRMVSERLAITPEQIEIRYLFENDAPGPIDATVAFPMPAFGWNAGFSEMDLNNRPLDTFVVNADGERVSTEMQRRALLDGRDITADLRRAGLSERQIFTTFGQKKTLRNSDDISFEFTPAQISSLTNLGALREDVPTWRVEETAYWQQIFPGYHPLEVTHRYKPFAGIIYTALYPEDEANGFPALPLSSRNGEEYADNACVSEGLAEGARNRILARTHALFANGAKGVMAYLTDVEYILGTARNWKGPIGDFTLNIRATSRDDIVSVCFPGTPARQADGSLEYHFTNFVPAERIQVNFYHLEAIDD